MLLQGDTYLHHALKYDRMRLDLYRYKSAVNDYYNGPSVTLNAMATLQHKSIHISTKTSTW